MYECMNLLAENIKHHQRPLVEAEPLPEGSKLPTSDGNYVYNGDFSRNEIQENIDGSLPFGTGWNFVHVPDFGGSGSVSIERINNSNFAKIDITSAGTQDYAVQLIQIVPMGKGRWYRLSFDAMTDSNRSINVKIGGGAERGWTSYTDNFKAELTNEVKHFENVFQMQKDSDAFARLEFQLGLSTKPVWIGNVRLEEIPAPEVDYNASKEPLPDGNHIYNGTFDKGYIDRMTYWNFKVDGAKATVSIPENTREITININNGGNYYESILLFQRGIQLLKDSEYRLTFKARADLNRTIKVAFLDKEGKFNYVEDNMITLTKSMQEYTIDFKMVDQSDLESQIVFKLGGSNANVYIDDVKLIKTSNPIDYSKLVLYPLKNGDFSSGLDMWKPYPNIGDGADSTITVENGEAKISVRNAGPNPWSILLNQEGFKMHKGIEYVLAFDVRASESRNIEVVIDNAAYYRYFSKVVEAPAGSQMKHYEFTFKMEKDEIANLKFLLGKTDETVPYGLHNIYIDNVVLEVKYNMIRNGDFGEGTKEWIRFMANWEGAYSTFNVVNGEALIHIDFEGTEFWSTQLAQERLKIEKGKTYVVSFDARSSISRKIQVIIEQNGGAYTKYLEPQVADLTNEMKRFTFEFTMNNDTDPNAHIVFALGKIDGNEFPLQPHDIFIDNVVVEER
ncbi:carbohydrate binding domain-containing protein [Caloramator sp. mosi_1]|uniref:carbohydrate binding domain-containing protein n=1 Tax=Caloramator sp. mosi_1 TaxID=3023090 RepID=UPI002361770C|nr:carbohydrate binding domain-containing protein [Caloramator sp. mosi_1]WDC85130.1 carbohydrate binding domain-containing protein [Caloramator sp. mosi_1]